MTPEDLADLARYPQLPPMARELIRVAGVEAAARLMTACPGAEIAVPMRVGGGNPSGARAYDRLAEWVGEPAADRIVAHWGGQRLAVPKCHEARRAREHEHMRADFDRLTMREGYSAPEAVFELTLKYRTNYRSVERILARGSDVQPADLAQLTLF